MAKEPRYFKRRRWYTGILIRLGLAARYKRIPIFGIQASGKSYFSFSIAQFMSRYGFGNLLGAEAGYLAKVSQAIMRREPLDATAGNREISLHLEAVNTEDYERVTEDYIFREHEVKPDDQMSIDSKGSDLTKCNILISTNDMSGTEFRNAMLQIQEPNVDIDSNPLMKRFLKIIDHCDGSIVVIDLVREKTSIDPSQIKSAIYEALSEQVVPLVSGIQMAVKERNRRNKVFPLFLVFTKRDIHKKNRNELYEMVQEVFALAIAQFDDIIKLRVHSVTNLGFIDSEDYFGDSEGISYFLADLHALSERM